ncbi:phage virion morphogenesis protein [Sphingosinicella sp. CPCC 101087]|uniref:phage virion morphogenesis protein n=1 Tax=Sphingosinicella sp. CPCC 101087 TaxID=2497754 RepID=UPI00101B8D03|nr:phage virion morphogenesis protein [Sphingosinicella sp. CPCC 101087]
MADFEDLERNVGELLARLDAGARRRLTREIAVGLRRSQSARIASQRNPDGSAYEPRKAADRPRDRRGAIRRRTKSGPMFRRLRLTRYLRAESDPSQASVGFAAAAVTRIARVHQLGLRDRVSRRPGAPEVTYPRRELVGFTAEEDAWILDIILARR